MKVALETLGCKLNQAETESLARQLTEAGHSLVSSADAADIYILNTCTVTQMADSKARHRLRLVRRRNPGAFIVATGCYAQRAPGEFAQMEGVNLVIGNDKKEQLAVLLAESGCMGQQTPVPLATASPLRTRAMVKIQDGCSNFCTYCIVPLVRGGEKSIPSEQIVAEIRQRVAEGYQEVVLTGTRVGAYHHGSLSLQNLLERILAGTDIARIRLSSLQPQEVSTELIGLWRDSRLCPHFHLSLQSGSDGVLSRMKRGYSVRRFQEAISFIREQVPNVAITTDVIVGFPGESKTEFAESEAVCRELQFARIHVFSYSPRQGTLAARMSYPVPDKTKKERSERMLVLAGESSRSFRQQYLGKTLPVLWEQQADDGRWTGLTDNYIRVYTRSNEDLSNKLLPVNLGQVRMED